MCKNLQEITHKPLSYRTVMYVNMLFMEDL